MGSTLIHKIELIINYRYDSINKKIIVTSQSRTYTKAFLLNDVKRWQSVEYLLEKVLEVL